MNGQTFRGWRPTRPRGVFSKLAEKLAETSTTLLITGESGTGKDQLARWIHEHGSRRDAPFLKN